MLQKKVSKLEYKEALSIIKKYYAQQKEKFDEFELIEIIYTKDVKLIDTNISESLFFQLKYSESKYKTFSKRGIIIDEIRLSDICRLYEENPFKIDGFSRYKLLDLKKFLKTVNIAKV